MNAISGMHKNGCRFFMTVPQGMTRKEFLQKRDIDYDGELFDTKVKRLESHFKNNRKKDSIEQAESELVETLFSSDSK
jgi:hypothetical protein